MAYPKIIEEARTALSVNALFYYVIMMRETIMHVVGADNEMCPTACTDGRNVHVNEDFFTSELKSIAERVFVMAHEVEHVALCHPQKMRLYATTGLCGYPFLPGLYNRCADAGINRRLTNSGIGKMPEMGILMDDVNGSETAEEVYERRLKECPPDFLKMLAGCGPAPLDEEGEDDGGGGDGEGDGEGGRPSDVPGAKGGDRDVKPSAKDAPDASTIQRAVAAAAATAKAAGCFPAGMKTLVDQVLESRVDWRQELRDFFVTSVGRDETSWRRPNRRKLVMLGAYLPRKMGMRCGPIVFGSDTSGSMGKAERAAGIGELVAILTDVKPESLHVVWCDAQVERVDELEEASELLALTSTEGLPGGGGTLFDPVFDWVEEQDLEPAAVLYFTDMYPSRWPTKVPPYPVLWLATTDVKPPFGQVVRIRI